MLEKMDRGLLWATSGSIVGVVGINFATSYQHIRSLGLRFGEDGYSAALMPVGIDGMLLGLGFANVLAAKFLPLLKNPHKFGHRMLRAALGFGVGGTVAANGAYGAWWGTTGALLGTWSPVALFIAVEAGLFAYKIVGEYISEELERRREATKSDKDAERKAKANEASKQWRQRQQRRGPGDTVVVPPTAPVRQASVDNGQPDTVFDPFAPRGSQVALSTVG
jgi:hypothetical protein